MAGRVRWEPAAPRLAAERRADDAGAPTPESPATESATREWHAADVTGDATGASIERIEIVGCTLRIRASGARGEGARIADSLFEGCELSGVQFPQSRWQRVVLRDCRLSGADLGQAHLRDVRFVDCRLDEVNLRMIDAQRVQFEGCELTRADFGSARLAEVACTDCTLAEAELSGAGISGLRLHGSRVDGLRGVLALRGAVIDPDQVVALGSRALLELGVVIRARDSDEPA